MNRICKEQKLSSVAQLLSLRMTGLLRLRLLVFEVIIAVLLLFVDHVEKRSILNVVVFECEQPLELMSG